MNGNLTSETDMTSKLPATTDSKQEEIHTKEPVSVGRRIKRLFWHFAARQFALFCVLAVKLSVLIGRRKRELLPGEECEIMLTGRFDSNNWILAHLGPLSVSKECSRIWMVSTNPVPEMPKVIGIYPSKFLMKIMGATPARLITFLWAAMRKRPHIVGGFHMIPNGIGTAIVGSLTGARSMYFCVGGPPEILDGGIHSEAGYFRNMGTPDHIVEKRLLSIISKFNLIITMGTNAIDYFRDKGVNAELHALSGGIDSSKFKPSYEKPAYDLILTGRLAEIKRIDIFLEAVKLVKDNIPEVKAVIVGDGKLQAELKQIAFDLGVDQNVYFAGHQNKVEEWLQKSRIFALTSDSEGLSLSMMEAMMCGLPAVVSDVGDLGDLVDESVNGFLVPRRNPEMFAVRIIDLLIHENKLKSFSKAARDSAMRYSTQAATEKWDYIINSRRSGGVKN